MESPANETHSNESEPQSLDSIIAAAVKPHIEAKQKQLAALAEKYGPNFEKIKRGEEQSAFDEVSRLARDNSLKAIEQGWNAAKPELFKAAKARAEAIVADHLGSEEAANLPKAAQLKEKLQAQYEKGYTEAMQKTIDHFKSM